MFRSFHFMYPFLGESLPTIFENGLVIHKYEESVDFGSASCSKNSERLVGNRRLGWSDQERHGSREALLGLSKAWTELSKDWLPIKIPHCTLSIVLYPGSAACYSYESGIEPR